MEIIKCKDCKHYEPKVGDCYYNNGLSYPDPEDFCSHGEEKLPELKPCPFCRSIHIDVEMASDSTYYCECHACSSRTVGFFDKKTAIAAWNRRAESEAEKIDLNTNWCIQFIPKMDYETYSTESISGVSNERKIIKGYSYPVTMRFWNKKDYAVK